MTFLAARLAAAAELVPKGVVLADIGTDHAYLPLALLQKGHIPFAIATDLREGPLQNAAKSARASGMADRLSLRLGNGLEPIAHDEASCVVLAGMGGETIAQILEQGTFNGDPVSTGDPRLFILQPMTKFSYLRRYLAGRGFGIADWRLAKEGRHLYECWAVTQCALPETDELYYYIGRKTPQTAPLYNIYAKDRLYKLRKKRNGLARSATAGGENEQRLSALIERMEKEVLL